MRKKGTLLGNVSPWPQFRETLPRSDLLSNWFAFSYEYTCACNLHSCH